MFFLSGGEDSNDPPPIKPYLMLLIPLIFMLGGIQHHFEDKNDTEELSRANMTTFIGGNTMRAEAPPPMDSFVSYDIISKVYEYDWDPEIALNVLYEESRGRNAYNPEWHNGCRGSYGLFQIACVHSDNPAELLDPDINIETAYKIWQEENWTPWSVCKNGKVRCW